MQKPLVFCLTPVKNEAWILERFLNCASLWADQIIVADQGSTDGSKEIAAKFPKVITIDNPSTVYHEIDRQDLVAHAVPAGGLRYGFHGAQVGRKAAFAEARRTPGPKVLLALDADEFLSANFLTSPEWQSILNAPPGTAISFQWPTIDANVSGLSFFDFKAEMTAGFVDDGSPHQGLTIHSMRVPVPPGCPTLALTQIKLMHYCRMDRNRFESRIRWYQCFEYLSDKKRPIELYRSYHPVFTGPASVFKPVPSDWTQGYEERGIDVSSVNRTGIYPWDENVLGYFGEFGLDKFRRLPIWDVDWAKIHRDLYHQKQIKPYHDPRSLFEKLIHRWLKATQHYFSPWANPTSGGKFVCKCVQKILGLLGW